MSYSTIQNVMDILPNASGIITDSAYGGVPENLISNCQSLAYDWINSIIRPFTVTPNSSLASLVLAESQYCSYLILQGTSAIGDDSTLAYADRFRTEAKRLIDEAEYPASADTPVKASGFIGNGSISVVVNDYYSINANWEARYQTNNTFSIWNTLDGAVGNYDIVNDTQFPDPTDTTTASRDAIKSIVITIVAGSTAFAKNDTWRFKTWSSSRKRKGIKFRRLGHG